MQKKPGRLKRPEGPKKSAWKEKPVRLKKQGSPRKLPRQPNLQDRKKPGRLKKQLRLLP